MIPERQPVAFTIDDTQGVIFVTPIDAPDVSDCLALVREIVRHPAYHPGFDLFIDARTLHRLPTSDTVHTLADVWRRSHERFLGRCAMLVSTSAAYGLGRTFEVLSADTDQFCTFREEALAMGWLEVGGHPREYDSSRAVLS